MYIVRALLRFIAFAFWASGASLSILTVLGVAYLLGRKEKARQRTAHKFFRIFLKGTHIIMGIRIHWHGDPPSSPSIIMGNHRSYVDAIVLPTSFPVVFVARHETKSWPIIGWGASVIGTIWVKRDKKDSRRATRLAVKERFDNGYGVVIFPEGTTHKGPELLPYHQGIFYTCAENEFQIVPAAIEYKNPDIAWVDDVWFLPHALKHFGAKYIDTHVSFGPTFKNNDAELLREEVRDWTQNECFRMRAILDGKKDELYYIKKYPKPLKFEIESEDETSGGVEYARTATHDIVSKV